MDKYAYFFGTSLFLLPWIILFIARIDTRQEMLWSSFLVGVGGLIVEGIWYTKDWVHPTTLTNTLIGIEDFIMGFGAGGIGTVFFKVIFQKDEYRCVKIKNHWLMELPVISGIIVADLLFRILGIFSYEANLVGFLLIILIIFVVRHDLIKGAIVGGLLLTAVTLPIYWSIYYCFPVWKGHYWNWGMISGIEFLNIPYEDLVWWFLVGTILTVVHDYTNGLRLRKLRRVSSG